MLLYEFLNQCIQYVQCLLLNVSFIMLPDYFWKFYKVCLIIPYQRDIVRPVGCVNLHQFFTTIKKFQIFSMHGWQSVSHELEIMSVTIVWTQYSWYARILATNPHVSHSAPFTPNLFFWYFQPPLKFSLYNTVQYVETPISVSTPLLSLWVCPSVISQINDLLIIINSKSVLLYKSLHPSITGYFYHIVILSICHWIFLCCVKYLLCSLLYPTK